MNAHNGTTSAWLLAPALTLGPLGCGASMGAPAQQAPGELSPRAPTTDPSAPCEGGASPGGPRFRDGDGDGFGAGVPSWGDCDALGDGWAVVGGDCDDGDPLVTPASWRPDGGAPIDLSAWMGRDDGHPVPLSLDVGGTLTLCPGHWPAALVITAPVSVGAWQPGVVLSGAGTHTPVTVTGARGHATLTGITVRDGHATADVTTRRGTHRGGGGLRCDDGATLTLHRVTVRDNHAEVGGGVFAGGSCTVALNRTLIAGNHASEAGGGVALQDAGLTSHAGAIADNQAAAGGGIDATGGALDLDDTDLLRNLASVGAGGLSAHATPVTLTDLRVAENRGASAGGLHAFLGQLDLLRVEVDGNLAAAPEARGGGARVDAAQLFVNDSDVRDNVSTTHGGGIAADLGAQVSLVRTHILGNSARGSGGGVWLGGAASMRAGGVRVSGNHAHNGGGVAGEGAGTTVALTDAEVVENEAVQGAGLWIDGATTILERVSIARNAAAGRGGGLALLSGDVTLLNVIADDNTAQHGGGICAGATHLIATGLAMGGNGATETGGAMHLQPSSVVSVTGLEALANDALEGGGVYVEDQADLQLIDSTVRGNRPDDVRHASGGTWTVGADGLLTCAGHSCG